MIFRNGYNNICLSVSVSIKRLVNCRLASKASDVNGDGIIDIHVPLPHLCTVMETFFSSLSRDLQKAADAAFQDRNVAGLEELQSKASRHPQLMEHIKMLKAKLGH